MKLGDGTIVCDYCKRELDPLTANHQHTHHWCSTDNCFEHDLNDDACPAKRTQPQTQEK